ncbi:pyridoxal phosphate-dependent aminotransferase [Rhodobacteraceae bacterium 2376]|uniref:cysteine-S-conjugate beta-lyase n=1 Tax=Rhabdonatronobacter sediminivivens TaxID=2743469 RepID=A0A7Z0HYH5_9RHOB|nr:MalY/PatB family protein [Rhabdonatronobacter sediminivivens]NYS24626.1 pyridoxal phosphate-dependent aminotransferase [Rhabdonatronobacter sediminivivens]
MDFDRIIDRRGSHSMKWDMMAARYGVDPAEGLPMWVADMDFAAPDHVTEALRAAVDHGVFGYFGDDRAYLAAICWWMEHRHGWTVDPAHIFTTHGLVNGTALCLQAFTDPGDGVVLFTPVYHAFARVIEAAGRRVVECPMVIRDGRYELDFDAADATMTGAERMVILCSPHNPGGRVWSGEELRAMAAFAARHDLLLVSDEIHHDLVMPGHRHTPMPLAAPECLDRLVMLTAASKTFNMAGLHVGNVIIPDAGLRKRFAGVMAALGISPNSLGLHGVTAAYDARGADWVDALCAYLDGNRRLFDEAIAAIPGLRSMSLEATYLAWVDFSDTGMTRQEFTARVEQGAGIAANHGTTFGTGGESCLRFNLAAPRSVVQDACARLQRAFADLQ